MDDDGVKDVVNKASAVSAGWMRNTGSATFAPWAEIYGGSIWQDLHFHDLNTDGIDDLLLVQSDRISTVPSIGSATYATSATPLAGAQVLHVSAESIPFDGWTADLDNDGDLELVYSGRVTGQGPNFLALMPNFSSGSRISGTSFVDEDGDGIHDPGEPGIPGLTLTLSPGGTQPMTSSIGEFSISADPGNYDLQCLGTWDPALWTSTAGATGYQFTLTANSVEEDLDFGLTALVDSGLIAPSLTIGSGACGTGTSLWVAFTNLGTRTEEGEVQLTLDPAYTFVSSIPVPLSISGNVITWAYDSLPPFSSFGITAEVQLPTADIVGETLVSTVQVSTIESSNVTALFNAERSIEHVCTMNPNDKLVDPAGYGEEGYIDIGTPHLDYTIRFQNTSNTPVVNMVLLDQLSPSLLPSSLQVLGYSHTPSQVLVHDDGQLEIRFQGILLPDSGSNYTGSQGYVRFRINLQNGLAAFTEINNKADIFFDFNDAVLTNTTRSTLVDCSAWMPEISFVTTDSLIVTAGDLYQWYFNGEPIQGANEQAHRAEMLGSYNVQVWNEYGCTALATEVQVITLGLIDRHVVGILVYPNPVGEVLHIATSEVLTAQHRVDLVDALGRVQKMSHGNGTAKLSLDCAGLANGVYVLQVLDENTVLHSARIIIQR